MPLLDATQLNHAAQTLPHWTVRPEALERRFEFPDFLAAMRFVNALAALAEEHGHHPDIDIRYNQVLVRTWSHDSGGVTERDLRLAQAVDSIAAS